MSSEENREFKDILRIESTSVTHANLRERQLGIERPLNDLVKKTKLKYRPTNPSDSTVNFTPDKGEAQFQHVDIIELQTPGTTLPEENQRAATRKYVDDSLKIAQGADPLLNGFVSPEKVKVTAVPSDSGVKVVVTSRDEPFQPLAFYVNNRKFELVQRVEKVVTADVANRFFVFLNQQGELEIHSTWKEGMLPIISGALNNSSSSIGLNHFMTLTRDYHGTSMASDTKRFVNSHEGIWIESGVESVSYSEESILRSPGIIRNDDTPYFIPSPVQGQWLGEIRPICVYMSKTDWGMEEFAVDSSVNGTSTDWVSHISSAAGTKAQGGSGYDIGDASHGTWYMHFVRSDARGVLDSENGILPAGSGEWNSYNNYNDVIVPVCASHGYAYFDLNDRYNSNLDSCVRNTMNHYIDFACDWKALGLFFVDAGKIIEYVNIRSMSFNELRNTGLLSRILSDKEGTQIAWKMITAPSDEYVVTVPLNSNGVTDIIVLGDVSSSEVRITNCYGQISTSQTGDSGNMVSQLNDGSFELECTGGVLEMKVISNSGNSSFINATAYRNRQGTRRVQNFSGSVTSSEEIQVELGRAGMTLKYRKEV